MSLEEEETDDKVTTSFTILDILRIIGGLLFFNAILSWWFTSTGTWGYNGKWLDHRYIRFRVFQHSPLELTLDELAHYDGSNPNLPIYLAVNGSVFDVTSGSHVYAKDSGGIYSKLSGRDCARVFVTGCLDKLDEFTYDLRGLDPEEVERGITLWHRFYNTHERYWYVGTVTHEPLEGDPPAPCEHLTAPM